MCSKQLLTEAQFKSGISTETKNMYSVVKGFFIQWSKSKKEAAAAGGSRCADLMHLYKQLLLTFLKNNQ